MGRFIGQESTTAVTLPDPKRYPHVRDQVEPLSRAALVAVPAKYEVLRSS